MYKQKINCVCKTSLYLSIYIRSWVVYINDKLISGHGAQICIETRVVAINREGRRNAIERNTQSTHIQSGARW